MSAWRRWFFGFLLVAALLGVVLHFGEVRNFVVLLDRVQPAWLAAAVLLQLSTYACLALAWRTVLNRSEPCRFRMRQLIRIALCKLFADQAVPTAGMSGNVVLVDQLIGIGASRGAAVSALLLSMLGFYASYLLYALIALFLLWVHGAATPLMVGLVTTFILVAIGIPALALWLRRPGSEPLPRAIEAIPLIRQLIEIISEAPAKLLKDRRLLLLVTLFNAAVFAADILTLWALIRGLGAELTIATALLGFILASIVVTLGPIPFGLGSFEVVCTSTLHMLGLALETALAGTLLLRFLILWLPLAPGFLLSRHILIPGKSKISKSNSWRARS